jgi:hypothetical protein
MVETRRSFVQSLKRKADKNRKSFLSAFHHFHHRYAILNPG